MSLRMNFFPLHFIVTLLLLVVGVVANAEIIFLYMESNIYLNGFIIALFIFATFWSLGVLSYFGRSSRILNKLLTSVNSPLSSGGEGGKTRKQALYVSSTIAGTLVDSPVVSKILSSSMRAGKLSVSYSDSLVVVSTVRENGARVLAPVKFIAGIFTILGLLGTFVGLLETIDGVGNALAAVSDVGNLDILALVKLFAEPLKGMSIAFSASLFALASSLISNYSVFVCEYKLKTFTNKLQNYLTAGVTLIDADPNKIEAKDILISLDESFAKLYNGLAERLDVIADGIFAMSKIIVRTQERQDKLLSVMTEHYEAVSSFADKIPEVIEYLSAIPKVVTTVEDVLNRNCDDIMNYLDNNVVKLLNVIAGASVDGVDIVDELTEVASTISSNTLDSSNSNRKSLDISEKIAPVIQNISGQLGEVVHITDNVSDNLSSVLGENISQNNALSDIVMKSSEGVSVLLDIATIGAVQSQSLSDILNVSNVSSGFLNDVAGNLQRTYQVSIDNLKHNSDASNTLNKILNTSSDILDVEMNSKELLSSLDANASSLVNSVVDHVNVSLDARKVLISLDSKMTSVVSGDYRSTINTIAANSSAINDLTKNLSDDVSFISDKLVSLSVDLKSDFDSLINGLYLSNELSNSILTKLVAVDYSDFLNDIAYELEGYRNAVGEFSQNFTSLNRNISSIVSSSSEAVNSIDRLNELVEDSTDKTTDAIDLVKSEISIAVDKLEEISNKTVEGEELLNSVSDVLSEISSSVSLLEDVKAEIQTSNDILDNISTNNLSGEQFATSVTAVNAAINDTKDVLNEINSQLDTGNSLSNDILNNSSVVVDQLSEVVNTVNAVDVTVQDMSSSVQENTNILREVIDTTNNNSDNMQVVADGVVHLSEVVSESMARFSDMSVTVQNDMKVFSSNFQEFKEQFDAIVETFQGDVDAITNAARVADVLQSEINGLSNVLDTMTPFLANLVETTMDSTNEVSKLFSVFGGMNEAIQSMDNKTSIQLSALENLSQQLYSAHEASLSFIDNVMQGFSALQQSLASQSLQEVNLINTLKEVVVEFSQLKDIYSQEILNITNGFENALNNIMNSFNYIAANTHDFGTVVEHFSNFVNENRSIAQDNTERLDNINNSMVQALNSQGDYFMNLSAMLEQVNDSISGSAHGFMNKLNSFEDALKNQLSTLQGVHQNISNIDEYRNGFLSEVSEKYKDMQDLIVDVSQTFAQAANNLSNVNEIMFKQLEVADVNAQVTQVMSGNISAILAVSENIREVGGNIIEVSSSFKDLSNNLDSLKGLVASNGKEFSSFINGLSSDIKVLSTLINNFSGKLGSNNKLVEVHEETIKLVDSIALFINKFEDFAKRSLNQSDDLKYNLLSSSENIQSMVSSLKDSFASQVSTMVRNNLQSDPSYMNELRNLLSNITVSLNKIVDNSDKGADIYFKIDNVLERINDTSKDESLKLNLIANAIDSLITEILNSRDISEAILEVLNIIASKNSNISG